MHHKKLWCLFLAGLFCSLVSSANAQTYTFRTYSIQDGLSQSVVHAMIQDSKGYIWVGSGYGLDKFDGATFHSYYTEQGLIHNRIYSLWESPKKRIWIGTEKGISIYDGQKFTNPANINKLINSPVNAIYGDHEGRIWLATEGNGIIEINGSIISKITIHDGLTSNRVRSITETNDGALWFATRDGISRYYKGNFTNYTQIDGLVNNRTRAVLSANDGTLWIGTRGGLSHFVNGRFVNYTTKNGLVYNLVRSLLQDSNGILWIGTEDGLSRFDGKHFKNYKVANGLSNNYIYSMLEDSEGNLWLGTYGGGMNRFMGERFTNYTMENGLSNNVITGIAQDHYGNLWFGTYGGGLNELSDHHVSIFNKKNGLIDDRIYCVKVMKDNSIWIGTRDGISIMKNGKIEKNNPFTNLPYRKIRCINKMNDGSYWLGTDDEGVLIYKNHKFKKLQSSDGLAGNNIRSILQDSTGDIWIGTSEGITRIHNGKLQNYSSVNGLIHNGVLDIYEDTHGNIWFATFGGLSYYHNGVFKSFGIKDGLRNSVCYTITQDSSGYYWVGTNKGILRLSPTILSIQYDKIDELDSPYIKRFTSHMGLVSNEMNWGSIAKDSSGNIWFGSVGGLIKLNPRIGIKNQKGPPVYITGMTVMDKKWPTIHHVVLDYNQNFVTFNYVGLCYSAPEMVLYEYRLKGADNKWIYTNKRSVRFSALTNGYYTFEVRARNNDGIWSNKTASIRFQVEPPFWESWWFRFLIGTIIIALIALIYNNFRIGRMVDMERIRVRIASDLHDDVGSSLTEIALLSDFLQAENLPGDVADSVKQIGEQSRRIVNTMDDIVWSIDARNDSAGDLTDRIQDYANRVLGPKHIVISYDFQELSNERNLPVEFRQNMYLIFKEAINNIAKHSNAQNVEVILKHKNNHFVLTIHDDGKGIKDKEKLTGHGLKNIKMRAERIGAKIEFLNTSGFTIKITGKGL